MRCSGSKSGPNLQLAVPILAQQQYWASRNNTYIIHKLTLIGINPYFARSNYVRFRLLSPAPAIGGLERSNFWRRQQGRFDQSRGARRVSNTGRRNQLILLNVPEPSAVEIQSGNHTKLVIHGKPHSKYGNCPGSRNWIRQNTEFAGKLRICKSPNQRNT